MTSEDYVVGTMSDRRATELSESQRLQAREALVAELIETVNKNEQALYVAGFYSIVTALQELKDIDL